ncbi:MAG: cyclase family protein [Clostridiaceae bacterium]|nr:cyclase family protein [Clostridiaceae bacterium]
MSKTVDLTHIIDPKKVQRKFAVETIGAETINKNVVRKQGQWYIMSNISMVSHIGTHIEVPYHILPDGYDLAEMPLDAFYGDAVLLDFSDIQERVEISLERVKTEADRIGGIPQGSIVFCNLGYADRYGQEEYSLSPYFSTEAIEWLSHSGMKMMGVDAGGVELPASEEHVNHTALFSNNIPLIENVANLNSIDKSHFKVTAFPYPIAGVEAFPLRVVAFL